MLGVVWKPFRKFEKLRPPFMNENFMVMEVFTTTIDRARISTDLFAHRYRPISSVSRWMETSPKRALRASLGCSPTPNEGLDAVLDPVCICTPSMCLLLDCRGSMDLGWKWNYICCTTGKYCEFLSMPADFEVMEEGVNQIPYKTDDDRPTTHKQPLPSGYNEGCLAPPACLSAKTCRRGGW